MSFCRHVVTGVSQSEAYRLAYDAGGMQPATVHREASRLMANPRVATRITALQYEIDSKVVSDQIADKTEVLETLTRILRGDQEATNLQLRAGELLGKYHGVFEQMSPKPVERSPEEIMTELFEILERSVPITS